MTSTTTIERDQYEHARSNASGWFEEIRDAYRATKAARADDDGDETAEQIEERMQERPLAVTVRSEWETVGATLSPAEYQILLTTGGPALRLYGELDDAEYPDTARLEMQDWGVPWREVWPCELSEMDEAREALMWFAHLFYFGS